VVVDRRLVQGNASSGLTESVETALNLADGIVVLEFVDREATTDKRAAAYRRSWLARTANPWQATTWSRRGSRQLALRRMPGNAWALA